MTMTPEQFLAEREPDEDLDEIAAPGDPLAVIATSLMTITEILMRRDAQERAEDEAQQLTSQLDAEFAELRTAYEKQAALVEQVLAVCKPSTSKLANAIRAALQPEQQVPAAEDQEAPVEPSADSGEQKQVEPRDSGERIVGEAPQCPACERYFTDPDLLARHPCTAQPAHDAPLEEWLSYAAARGLDVDPGRTNRSQIRTMLGIAQPVRV